MNAKWNQLLKILLALVVLSGLLNSSQSVTADTLTPTVDGLFYGPDGYEDSVLYTQIGTSYYGSKLYAFFDAPNQLLYVALVVNRSVNDNVFKTYEKNVSYPYMVSAGWSAGKGQQRSAYKLIDSEYAGFNFACEVDSDKDWSWHQGYGCEIDGTWVSDERCGTSTMTGNAPDGLTTASSFVWNINTYRSDPTPAWNMYAFASDPTDPTQWTSPYDPANPDTVIGLDGYPAATQEDDLSVGPDITFSDDHQWEWAMVYEWSLDLSSNGADCQDNALYVVTGTSHHSPLKEGTGSVVAKHGTTQMETWCMTADNDCFPVDGGSGTGEPSPFSDWGDLLDSYSTTNAASGPYHIITANGPFLGSAISFESDGQPTDLATGDGSEEDGVTPDHSGTWEGGNTVNIDVTVGGASGVVVAWFDFDNNGSFETMIPYGTLTTGTHSLDVEIPASFGVISDLSARFRIFDPAAIPGDSVDFNDFMGGATGGEVEDYRWFFSPTAVELSEFTASWQGTAVQVDWTTVLEVDTVGFNLLRSTQIDGEYSQINTALIPSATPGSTWGADYTFTDEDVMVGESYFYKLQEIESGGATNLYGPVEASGDSGPSAVSVATFSAVGKSVGLAGLLLAAGAVVLLRSRKRKS